MAHEYKATAPDQPGPPAVSPQSRSYAAALKKASVTKSTVKSTTASAAASDTSKTTPAKAPAKTSARTPTAARTPAAKKSAKPAATKTVAEAASAEASSADGLSTADLSEIKSQIEAELRDLRVEYKQTLVSLDELQRQATDTAGDDQADTGSKTFEREQEMSIAANRLDLITQMEHALHRIDAKTYGICENCGNPIPKARLQAFPSATLCVSCKAREERR